MRHLLISGLMILPLSVMAQDMALVLGQERYEDLDRVRGADNILAAQDRLERLGFEVLARANGRADVVRDLAVAFRAGAADADRLVVSLSGHFVTDGSRTWLLTAEAGALDLFTVQTTSVSVDSILQVLASKPGQAVLLLGQGDGDDLDLDGTGLRAGVGAADIPQGVTVISTDPGTAADTLSGLLTTPEAVIGARLASNRELDVSGYLPMDWTLMPSEVIVDEAEVAPPAGPTEDDLTAEAELWDQATAADTVEAYRTYIARYPEGRFVEDAEAQIAAIRSEPNRDARLTEEALNLSRDQRRDIQSDLTLLNYNTRGVDGIFGPGSRGAITNWQQSNGFPQTSYLDRDQINLLDAQAGRRQAEIEAEEARERAAAEARDRAYWAETGARGDEPGYRAYLERYPEGLFANIASARLATIEDSRRAEAEAADRAAWSIADSEDTLAGYREYLVAYPDGVFAAEARTRIEAASGPQVTDAQRAQARAEEENLRLSGVRAQLLELRLRDLGLNPGRLDGVIDDATRSAIAEYQQAEGITPTGFVDRRTAIGLISGSINITISD
ncbi:peptidoglycan-binding domain-containing protein [Pseudooctadecabacter jejudonensis]|uniref:Putative peptidoglycan binding domain protein n=1 Tax=Pseudooctadecabacter jejudonensis TaxID=1391910 RepID=A0A1Y5SCX6_9RHOB|nr:peptidoglycan-binding domain-containing protein [Pseudooctadecabacter jejudonensis]SLN36328.1 Putative peptidoglycan binding domain protein [Pseudooctadecabacter jejudonensis]